MSQADCRAIVWRQSYDVRANVANMPQRNFGEFTMRKFLDTRIIVVRQSRDSLENTCEHLATIWREIKTRRHECHETRSRMSRDFRTNENEAKATFVGIRKTPTND